MSRTRYTFGEPDRPHFLTCTIVHWLPVFTREEAAQILFDTWKHQQQHAGLIIYGFVVLENHLHAVAQAEDPPRTWNHFKSYTARGIVDLLIEHRMTSLLRSLGALEKARRGYRKHQVWQEGSHPEAIADENMLRQKLEYIHQNPVKRGYVDAPEHWRWSSARCYAGRSGMIEVFMDW